jgi:hypothetical protein
MDYAVDSVVIPHSTPANDAYDISIAVELLNEVLEEHPDAAQDVEAAALGCQESGSITAARISYGIADILFPMTPPAPKGARLIRGPLRFN